MKRRAWLSTATAAAALAAILAFLYAKTQHNDESANFENVARLRHLAQLDAQWELDVLRSRLGINAHYDSLADTLTRIGALLETRSEASLHGAVQDKGALIERFKSIDAMLRNSLAFLPTAAEDVQQLLGPAPAARGVAADVNHLLLACMLYAQRASVERGAEIRLGLSRIEADRLQVAPQVRERLDILVAHAATVLREQESVDALLGEITAVPTAQRIRELEAAFSTAQQGASVQSRRYRGYLLLFSAVLIGLLLYAAARLIRSHAEIRRVNEELHGANEHLEQRVRERTRELRQAQSELVTAARRAGMAEIATNVLHNVGNVLNSVNVSAEMIADGVRASKLPGLVRAVELINGHAADLGAFMARDPKGKMLPGYLEQLARVLSAEQQGIATELAALTKSVDHVMAIIATQQAHAGSSRLIEPMQVHDLLDEALRIHAAALERHGVAVERALAPLPDLPLDKGRILQILVNLIGNARQAMEGLTDREPRLTLRADLTGDSRLRIDVRDNGVGIAAEHQTRMFAHGFTTKKDGHGFGLHSAAIAAREMGGSLAAHSDGPGTGAAFTLEIPVATAEAAL